MQVVERSALVTYTPAQMFALVNDVPRYPEFLPWCVAARVEEVSATERIAMLKVARGVLKTEFTTRNTLAQDAQIHMRLMHGPFRDSPATGASRPSARAARACIFGWNSSSRIASSSAAFNAVFETLCGSIVDAFVMRAQKVYG